MFEIDREARATFIKESQRDVSMRERAGHIERCFFQSLVGEDRLRINPKSGKNRSHEFNEMVKRIAKDFANYSAELMSQPVRRVDPYPDSDAPNISGPFKFNGHGAVNTVTKNVAVAIGVATDDLETDVKDLQNEIAGLGEIIRFSANDLLRLSDHQLKERLQRARAFVQPFS